MTSSDDAKTVVLVRDDEARMPMRWFTMTLLALLLFVGGLNLFVNPMGAYPWTIMRPLTWSARNTKVDLMARVPAPDVLVLGSSRSMIIPQAEIHRALGNKTLFNASVDSAKAEDMYLVYKTANDDGFHPSVVLIGVDLEAFYDPAETDIRTLSNGTLRRHLPLEQQLLAFGTIGSTILSYTQVADSLRSLGVARHGYPNDKFRFDEVDGTFVWLERPPRMNPDEQTSDLDARFRQYRGLSPWRIELFGDTLALLRKSGASVYLFIPPMHPTLAAALQRNERFNDVRAKVNALMEAERAKGAVVTVRDFTDIESFGGLPDDFSDPLHILEENAARMTRALLTRP